MEGLLKPNLDLDIIALPFHLKMGKNQEQLRFLQFTCFDTDCFEEKLN